MGSFLHTDGFVHSFPGNRITLFSGILNDVSVGSHRQIQALEASPLKLKTMYSDLEPAPARARAAAALSFRSHDAVLGTVGEICWLQNEQSLARVLDHCPLMSRSSSCIPRSKRF